ncbi:MAG: energy transducer TonB [Ginsengibacter sp.]
MRFSSTKLRSLFFIIIILAVSKNDFGQTTDTNSSSNVSVDSVFSQVEVEASFPGGTGAWARYVTKAITENVDKLKKTDYGTCIIRFIVDTKGKVSEVEATTMKKSRLAKIAIEAIENGPRWHPAVQNGKPVNAYRLQPVTLTDPGK